MGHVIIFKRQLRENIPCCYFHFYIAPQPEVTGLIFVISSHLGTPPRGLWELVAAYRYTNRAEFFVNK